MEEKPFGYLVKPFNKADIYTSIEVAMKNYNEINAAELQSLRQLSADDYLFVKDKQMHVKIAVRDILYIRSELKDVQIFTKDGNKYLLRYNLSDIVAILPDELFIQTHRPYIVNIPSVEGVGNNFVMLNGAEIPLSSSRKEEFLNRFKFI